MLLAGPRCASWAVSGANQVPRRLICPLFAAARRRACPSSSPLLLAWSTTSRCAAARAPTLALPPTLSCTRSCVVLLQALPGVFALLDDDGGGDTDTDSDEVRVALGLRCACNPT